MISSEKQTNGAQVMSLRVVWRNPRALVKADLRTREASNAYCRWAEQASKIRARRSNWKPTISGQHEQLDFHPAAYGVWRQRPFQPNVFRSKAFPPILEGVDLFELLH